MKILFIAHNAHRAGSQIFLLNFLTWLKSNRSNVEFEILFGDGGVLMPDFQSLCSCFIINSSLKNNARSFKQRIKNKILINSFKEKAFDVLYSNTILNSKILKVLEPLKIPVLTHVHEMDYWISRLSENDINQARKSDIILSASESVKKILIQHYSFCPTKIKTVYVPVNCSCLLDYSQQKSLKTYLKLKNNVKLILACGTETYRKGKDWFIPLAVDFLTKTRHKDVHFVWIGGRLSKELKFDWNKSGFSNRIHFIDQIPHASLYFKETDVFLMLSREDPFPTVNLEMGVHGIPILCFDGTGGTNELLEDLEKLVVPYANLSLMGEAIEKLLTNEKWYAKCGLHLSKKIIENYDVETVCTNIINLVQGIKNKDLGEINLLT